MTRAHLLPYTDLGGRSDYVLDVGRRLCIRSLRNRRLFCFPLRFYPMTPLPLWTTEELAFPDEPPTAGPVSSAENALDTKQQFICRTDALGMRAGFGSAPSGSRFCDKDASRLPGTLRREPGRCVFFFDTKKPLKGCLLGSNCRSMPFKDYALIISEYSARINHQRVNSTVVIG